jgi:hypothetical protein
MNVEQHTVYRDQMKAMMGTGSPVTVLLDLSRGACTGFPTHLEGPIALNLGYNLPFPTNDLDINLVGFSVTLTFNRIPHLVIVPWIAVLAFRGPLVATPEAPKAKEAEPPPAKSRPSHLSVVKD